MIRTLMDSEYIVIQVKRDSLRRLYHIAVTLLLILPYPILYPMEALADLTPTILSSNTFMMGYTLLAPTLLILLKARTASGSPVHRCFRLCFFIWQLLTAALMAAGLILYLAYFSTQPDSEPLFKFLVEGNQDIRHGGAASIRMFLYASLYSSALLWICEVLSADLLGEFFWAAYFMNAGGSASAFTILSLLLDADAPVRPVLVRSSLLPAACGALVCVIVLIALLLQGSAGRDKRALYSGRFG